MSCYGHLDNTMESEKEASVDILLEHYHVNNEV